MNSVLVGMFDTRMAAEQARTRLTSAGFMPGQVVTGNADAGAGAVEPAKEGFFSNFMHNIFGTDDESQAGAEAGMYKEAMRRGAFGLTVSTGSDADTDRASDILEECGAVDVDERSEQWRSEGWTGAGSAAAATTAAGEDLAVGATKKLNLVEESLAVGKRSVARGGVRVFSRVVEVPVEESVRLREEHANIQRRVVDRPATEADFAAFKEGAIEVRNTAEEAVVSKTARVVGEVEIGKTVTEREQVVQDTLRHTEVDVQQLDGDRAGGMKSAVTGSAASTAGFADGSAGSANRDPISGEAGAHPVGTGIGAAAGGMAAGAAAGTVVGPVGTVVGAAVGAVAGGLAGKGVAEKIDPTVGNTKKTG